MNTLRATPTLTTRFAYGTRVLRQDSGLAEDQMRQVAPSIFATGKHASRSERYSYIPTIDVLRGLQKENFRPVMVAQGASRVEGKADYTKHLIRLRHGEPNQRDEAQEIILINSHDGVSAYQMLAGLFRYACANGLVVGDVVEDLRIPHKGQVQDRVIEGAFRVLDQFQAVDEHTDAMKALPLQPAEERAFATAALALRFGENTVADFGGHTAAPVTAEQLIEARRPEDLGHSLWHTFQRVQENVIRGGQSGRGPKGRRLHTRPVNSIDRNVSLNRALWLLAEEMRKLKA